MGRYFIAVNADTYEYVSPTSEGCKLMSHSYQGKNHFLLRVDRLLRSGGKWHMARIVWAGDSIPANDDTKLFLPTSARDGSLEAVNLYKYASYSAAGNPDGERMMPCNDPASPRLGRYIVNHDMLEFVDIESLPADKQGFKVHPLPLLTSEGGGYCGVEYEKEGRWSKCRVSIQDERPETTSDFNELVVAFE